MGAAGVAEKDGLKAQAAADGLFDDPVAFHGNVAGGGGLALGEGLAQVFDQRVLAAGDAAEPGIDLMLESHGQSHHTDAAYD